MWREEGDGSIDSVSEEAVWPFRRRERAERNKKEEEGAVGVKKTGDP